MAAPNEITAPQLLRLIGTPECPVIVDICIPPDFADDPFIIPGSIRHPHTDIAGLKALLQGRPCVIICQRGVKLSQGLAARLRADGVKAEYLQGGMHSWRDHAQTMRVPFDAIPARVDSETLWVTRHRPKIDRIACPWLIRRFVDPNAQFLFVSPAEVMDVADRFAATPFDIEGVPFSHVGPECTFDAMLKTFRLNSPALDRLAAVVRAADTNTHDASPEAAGLLAISVGLSRQYKDDNVQLEAGMALYDALYRWARDGQNETHDWPEGRAA